MHVTPDLTPAAMRRWAIPRDLGTAGGELRFQISDLKRESHDGGKVCRVIETGETMGRAKEFP